MRRDNQLTIFDLLDQPIDGLLRPDQIFASDDPALFVRLIEDDRFDRKSSRIEARDLAPHLSAFGNGPSIQGGVLAIGINNKREIEGCNNLHENKLQALESLGSDRCPSGRFRTRRLSVTNRRGQSDFIILVRIFYIENRLVELTDGSAYIRKSDKTFEIDDLQKQELRIEKGERAYELEACNLIYPDDFNVDAVKRFAKRVREQRDGSDVISDEQILEIMHLGKRKNRSFKPNNACGLIFGRDPQQIFPGAYVHFLRYEGTLELSGRDYNVVKDRILSGSILDTIKDTSSVLDANLREFTQRRNGKFYTTPEYPREAWYELVVNAVAHRSYHVRNSPVFVKLFDDRLVVESPGGFMPEVNSENLYDKHVPRNPFLMLALREYGEVRCINEGTKRIRREMLDAKLPEPEFVEEFQAGKAIKATLRNRVPDRTTSIDSEAYRFLGEAVSLSLDPEERRIVNYLIEHGRINVSDALRLMKTTYWHTAKKKMKKLNDRGIVDWISTKDRDPNAHFVLRKRSAEEVSNGK